MADAGVDDPFASLIIPNCQTTASQEEVLRRSRFAGESEAPVPDDNPPSGSLLGDSIEEEEEEEEPVTQIIIESLPDSQNDEEFQTPPEQATSLHFSGDDQAGAPARRTVSDGSIGGGGGKQDMEVDGEECGVEWRGVCVGQDADDLGFEGKKMEIEIGGKPGEEIEVIEVCDDGPRKLRRVEGEFCVSRVCKERSGAGISSDVVMVEVEQTEMGNIGAENRESGFKEVRVGLMDRLGENARKVSDKMPVRELEETVCAAGQNKSAPVENPVRESEVSKCVGSSKKNGKSGGGSGCVARKSIEDIDKFTYVRTGGKQELPFSLQAQGKNVDAESSVAKKLPFSLQAQAKNVEAESSVAKKGGLGDLLNGLKLLMGGVDDGRSEDDDFLKTAKKCGMTWPRPRWWPPEGFDA